MSVRVRLALLVSAVFLGMLGMMLLGGWWIHARSLERMEAQQARWLARSIDQRIDERLARLQASAYDWSNWTELARFARGEAPFPSPLLGPDDLDNLQINLLQIRAADGALLYSAFSPEGLDQYRPLPVDLVEWIASLPALHSLSSSRKDRSRLQALGIGVLEASGPVFACSIAISDPQRRDDGPAGVLLMAAVPGHRWGSNLAEQAAGGGFGLAIEPLPETATQLPPVHTAEVMQHADHTHTIWHRAGIVPGQSLQLSLNGPNLVYRQGSVALLSLVAVLLISAALGLLLILWAMQRMLFTPIRHLRHRVGLLRDHTQPPDNAPPTPGDELGQLAEAIRVSFQLQQTLLKHRQTAHDSEARRHAEARLLAAVAEDLLTMDDDLGPAVQRSLQRLLEHLQADHALLLRRSDDRKSVRCAMQLHRAAIGQLDNRDFPIAAIGRLQPVLQSSGPVAIPDLLQPEPHTQQAPEPGPLCPPEARALLAVQLGAADHPFGTLALFNDGEPRDWSRADLSLAARWAYLVAIALTRHDALTQLQTAREQAEAASRVKSDFLARTSHELRTPLHAILGYVEMAAEPARQPEALNTALTQIHSSALQLLELINDLLDLSKIEAGKANLVHEPVTIRQILDDAAAIAVPLARTNQNRFHLDCPDHIPTLHTDPAKLRQCLVNLLANACRFTRGGDVYLAAQADAEQQQVRLTVRDTGIGIDPDRLGRLFEAYEQADEHVGRTFGGTGLGLMITRQLVELMQGRISVQSRPGVGTTFHIDLPTQPHAYWPHVTTARPPSAQPQALWPPQPVEPLPPMRVLLVEDNPTNTALAVRMLERLGQKPVLATTGVQAIQQFAPGRFDCLLLDCHLPDMQGTSLAEHIRNLEAGLPGTPRVRIVAVTADGFPQTRAACLRAGMDEHIVKPLRTAELRRAILGTQPGPGPQPPLREAASNCPADPAGALAPLPIDLPAALRITDHDAGLLLQILRVARESLPQLIDELADRLQRPPIERSAIVRIAHTIKGTAANLAAGTLAQAAAAFECAAPQTDAIALEQMLTTLRSRCRELCDQADRLTLDDLSAVFAQA